ncbi:septum site-determining protein Ssd [Nocardia sp. IBHARD005]|uniref:septum site-determining protein Ssd n=1 Tax=Nocardia sp. IBHARD005 TaxID=3457765 RepID=UPI00405A0177
MNPVPMRSGSPHIAPALVLVRDDRLRAEVRRVAAAAERVTDERVMPVGRHAWAGAGMVILDTAAAVAAAVAGCPRRAGVVLVTEGEPAVPDWQAATAVGAERVVALPSGAVALVEQFAEHAESRTGEGIVVAVVGAGGGAGASTLAAATALRGAARRVRRDTVLIDGAPLDGGIDLVLGMENVPGLRWPDLIIEDGRVSAAALHNALPAASPGLAVLSCGRARPGDSGQGRSPSVSATATGRAGIGYSPAGSSRVAEHAASGHPTGSAPGDGYAGIGGSPIGSAPMSARAGIGYSPTGSVARRPRIGCSATELSPAAVRAVIESGRDAGDLVVCDVSSERGPAADAMLDAADLVVLIVPARLRSIAAAEVVSAYLGERNPNRGLVVRGPAPGGLRGAEVAELLGLPLLAAVRGQAGLASRLERAGLSVRRRGPLRDAADAVLAMVGADAP